MSMSPSRLDSLDWVRLEQQLDQDGCAIIRSLLHAESWTTTACTRTCTANGYFHCKWRFFCQNPGRTLPVAFLLTEQRPRMQSRPQVLDLKKGDAVIFTVNQRPVTGVRGDYRVTMRHGVSRLHSGKRHTLGIIFHDAT